MFTVALAGLGCDAHLRPAALADAAEPHTIEGFLVLDFPRMAPAQEISADEVDRLAGVWTREDSSRWIRSMKPGVGVLWCNPSTREIVLHVELRGGVDSVHAGVWNERHHLLQLPTIMPDTADLCTFTWDLRDRTKKPIAAGFYEIIVSTRTLTNRIYLVREPRGSKEAWRLRY